MTANAWFAPPKGAELVEMIGTGALCAAALVRDQGALVVCKRLLPRVRNERAARAAIAREAITLSRVAHPSLPALVRVGTDEQGPFVIEDHVRGESLRAVAATWRARGLAVPPSLVAHVAITAASALAQLHACRDADGPLLFVHGDIGPEHVIMGPCGEARFLDLTASQVRGVDRALLADDRGTLPFVAPEVARGDAPPSQATDVYALAATLLAFGSGEAICDAASDAAMLLEIGAHGVRTALTERVIGLPPLGRDALAHALAFEPGARLVTARDLCAAFV